VPIVLKSGSLNLLEASGPVKACNGIALPFYCFAAGTLLCVCIVVCNLAVIRVLRDLGYGGSRRKTLGRRISRNSNRARSLSSGSSSTAGVLTLDRKTSYYNVSTPEEIAFARLMAVISVAFVVCWMPQMVSSSCFCSCMKNESFDVEVMLTISYMFCASTWS
jgi:hypothetical protein